ncbi:MAG: SURF1 family protein [Burkholderiaceae bacterium]
MTRSASSWALWLAAVAGVAFTARLGLWQLDRAAQRDALEHEQTQRATLPPLAGDALARTDAEAAAQRHRLVVVRGRWLSGQTLFLDNEPLEGRVGFIAVTPLLIGPRDAVLVQRGWAPRDPRDRTRVPELPTPDGEVAVRARIAPWPSRRFDLGGEDSGRIRQNLDADSLARAWGVTLRPLSLLELDDGAAAADGWARRWSAPAPGAGRHRGYAVQWFALAALIAGLTVWHRILKPRREDQR